MASSITHSLRIAGMAALVTLIAAGCAGRNRVPSTRPRTLPTDVDPETAKAAYWLEKPGVASVRSSNYERLFAACDHVLRQRYFIVDRADFRNGVVTSRPLISQQVWEAWRDDVGSFSQEMNSSLATYRRTVHWTIEPTGTDKFTATPKVVVERYTAEPRRVTAVTSYRSAVSSASAQTKLESPNLENVSTSRWYAVGRDKPLERELAKHATDWLIGG